VLREVFERTWGPSSPVARGAGVRQGMGVWLREWRLLVFDGFDVDVPTRKENAAEFGYAASGANRSAFSKA
jgi:hypothetical protein